MTLTHSLRTLSVLVGAVLSGMSVATAPFTAEIQYSTDAGATWANVASAGSATGLAWMTFQVSGDDYYGVVVVKDDEKTIFRVSADFLTSTHVATWDSVMGTGGHLTMTWDSQLEFVSVQEVDS